MEIADGILQQETLALISNKEFMSTVSDVVFSCGDSLSAIQAMTMLEKLGINPLFLCGKFTMSELLIKEVQQYLNVPIFTLSQLESKQANKLLNV
jgi:aspartokinase